MSQREKETARERSGLVSWPGQSLDGRSQRLTLAQLPRFTEVSGNPVHPQLQSCWPFAGPAKGPCLFWQFPLLVP